MKIWSYESAPPSTVHDNQTGWSNPTGNENGHNMVKGKTYQPITTPQHKYSIGGFVGAGNEMQ